MVESASVEIKSLGQIIEAVGTTKALRSIEITPLSSGRVEEAYLSVRAPVKAGSLLLKLDSVIEEADVMEAKAKLEEASRALQRSDTLQQSNGMSEAAIDGLRAQSKIALAALKRAHEAVQLPAELLGERVGGALAPLPTRLAPATAAAAAAAWS